MCATVFGREVYRAPRPTMSERRRTIVITGSASGMGRATVELLESDGCRIIGVDRHDAEVLADLSTPEGRTEAAEKVGGISGGVVDGVVTWAGLAGLSNLKGSLLVSVNYFGTVELLQSLRPMLARGTRPSAVAVSSNSTTCQPGIPRDVVDLCLSGDEPAARVAADTAGSLGTYPATKLAVAWWVRRNAPTDAWVGSGIALNAVVPGAIETPMLQATREDPVIGGFIDAFPIPVGRPGKPEELARVVGFLLGPGAGFCCGSVLFADGGTDALMRPEASPTPM
jgi:NAD(P)-dependent dehydrogenase (short-subunit alcohol dehydrogenase family)